MKALVDGDIVAFRSACSCDEDEGIAHYRVQTLMGNIKEAIGDRTPVVFFTGKNNFRYKINPDYKANRKDKPRPVLLDSCKLYLSSMYDCFTYDLYEADDALGFSQRDDTCICSIDKDLLMIPGDHYNFVKDVFTTVTEKTGLTHFYKQMLIGDIADNIVGVQGIGVKKASKLLDDLNTEEELYNTVFDLYKGDVDRFTMNANCLWIMRNEGEKFTDRKLPFKV